MKKTECCLLTIDADRIVNGRRVEKLYVMARGKALDEIDWAALMEAIEKFGWHIEACEPDALYPRGPVLEEARA